MELLEIQKAMNKKNPIKTQVFLVGCPRSGTTLLQSLLAANPEIASFPESHFFWYLLGKRTPWRSKFKLASAKAKWGFDKFLAEIERPELKYYLPTFSPLARDYARGFFRLLDDLTQEQGKSIWLEKTPEHINYIGYLESWFPGTKFIHLVRNGADVVASLYEVTHKHPNIWTGAWDIDRCINQWVKDVKLSYRHLHKSNHILVSYESLVENPGLELQKLCDFIEVNFEEIMLKKYGDAARKVTLNNEPWKDSVSAPISSANGKKFDRLFDEGQREYILQGIARVKLE